MFRKKTKKGFTIVELVIVIAVIAILSAVLIPTFAGLIKKANISADQTLVRNLNTSLAISSEGGGTKNSTMYQTLEAMKGQGYVVDKLTPTHSKNNIVWDSENNQFVLVYENGETFTGTTVDPTVDKSKMWKVYTEIPTESEYSVYLAGTNVTGNVEVKGVGFDAGENVGISTVTYKNEPNVAKDVVIRTNGGSLTINAENDTVKHYGSAKLVDIQKVAPSSYHEYGEILTAKIKQGRLVITEEANISVVKAVATDDEFTNIKLALVGNAELPTITRDAISLDSSTTEGTHTQLVLELQKLASETTEPTSSNTEYVWASVTVNGSGEITDSSSVVASSKTELNEQTKINDSTISESVVSTTKVSNATELANALNAKAKYILFANDISTTQTSVIDYSMTLDGDGYKLTSTTGNSNTSSKTITITSKDVEVSIINLITVETKDEKYGRGIQVEESGIKLTIENCEVNAMHYAINFLGGTSEEGANNCEVTIKNSTINGWGALNIWSHGLILNAYNSTFDGYNDKVYNNAGWNGFGTIVLEGDTTSATTKHAENCVLTFTNCKVTSASTTGNSQSPVLYNLYSKNNTIKFVGCTYSWSRPNIFCTNNGENNKLFIDGKQVVIGIDAFTFNTSNLVIADDGVTATGTIVVSIDSTSVTFDLSTVTGAGWKRNNVVVGTDYVFKNIVIDGTTYTFDFDIWSGYTGGWTLYLSANID